jgi:RNA polymerase sigma factor (sigma-70 family)
MTNSLVRAAARGSWRHDVGKPRRKRALITFRSRDGSRAGVYQKKCNGWLLETVRGGRCREMELLKRFTQGDVEAFETLFRQFQDEVYGWIVRIVRDPGIAEDLTLETFWRIYRARSRFDPMAPFGAWARRIATNLALDHVREHYPTDEFSERVAPVHAPNPALEEEIREQIAHAFERLPVKLRVPATLALIEERSYEEIAHALGKPAGTIRTRVFRAVRLLRKHLDRVGVRP